MRAILVDWLIDVHLKFKLLPETLFLSVNLIDRYLTKKTVPRSKLQLVGVTALMISAKYEEIYPPTIKDYVYITDNAYVKDDLLAIETSILTVLDFDIQQTSCYRFMERYSKISKLDKKEFYLAQYMLELSLLDSKMNQFLPSEIAAAAVFTCMQIMRSSFDWDLMHEYTCYGIDALKTSTKCLVTLLNSMQ